ncbi:MAG: nitrite/sulfite reductase [Deltaproteobacteria bacterium]|nr:nitrite/sulfite reductase [Deltaproteobacteria bacterium]
MTEHLAPVFPCTALPDDPTLTKLIGLYPQRQKGLWMQRIKIRGGCLAPEHWNVLADLAEQHTPGTPLYLTTRQCIEFHNLTEERISLLQRGLAAAGLTGLGACGDTMRNVTVCPCSGIADGKPDLQGLAATVESTLKAFPDIYGLPRKFKISFSACPKSCGQPWINDLGFVANPADPGLTFTLIGAGSLGARPATGISITDNLTPEQVPVMALAALRLFNKEGDRMNRRKARLRHVRERLGDTAFLKQLLQEFTRSQQEQPVTDTNKVNAPQTGYSKVSLLNFPCGRIQPQEARSVSEFISKTDAHIRIMNHHRLVVYAADTRAALDELRHDSILRTILSGPDIASCPGTAFCKHGLVNTHNIEDQLRSNLDHTCNQAIRISGCPNGCAHTSVGNIGLSGMLRKDNQGRRSEGFKILEGGGMGLNADLARTHSDFIPADEIVAVIKNMV